MGPSGVLLKMVHLIGLALGVGGATLEALATGIFYVIVVTWVLR